MTDHDRIAALATEIATGWTVDITDHDYLNDSRDGARVEKVTDNILVLRPRHAWSSQGRKFPQMNFTWDATDLEVQEDGHTVRLYRTPPPHTGKSRRLIKTFRFHPPTP